MAAYAVKPAAFDFLLTLGILAYLGLIYVFLQVSAKYLFCVITWEDFQGQEKIEGRLFLGL